MVGKVRRYFSSEFRCSHFWFVHEDWRPFAYSPVSSPLSIASITMTLMYIMHPPTLNMLFHAVDAVLVASSMALSCLPLHTFLLLSGVAGLQHLQLLVYWETRAALFLSHQLELSPLEHLPLCLSSQRLCQSAVSVLLPEKRARGS